MEHVVEEPVVRVPQALALQAHGAGNAEEVLEELGGHALVHRPLPGQLQRNAEHPEGVEGHPGGAVGLVDVPAGGQGGAAVEEADVVETEEAALEDVVAVGVLAVHPPGEVEQQLVEDLLQEVDVMPPTSSGVSLVNAPRRPGVDRRVDVSQGPLVGGELAAGVHVPLPSHELEVLLGEVGIDQGQRQAVERQVPGGVPRILPLVGHGEDVEVVEVQPVVVASPAPGPGRRGAGRIARQPLLDVVVVELLGPHHSRQRLTVHRSFLRGELRRLDGQVVVVGLGVAPGEQLGEIPERVSVWLLAEPEPQGAAFARPELFPVDRGNLGAGPGRVDRSRVALDQVAVESVLDVRGRVVAVEQAGHVGVVLGEQQLVGSLGVEVVAAGGRMLGSHGEEAVPRVVPTKLGAVGNVPHRPVRVSPAPCVAEPEGGQYVQWSGLGSPVDGGHLHQDVAFGRLGVLHEHVPVALLREHSGVEQFVLVVASAACPVHRRQLLVGEGGLRILVQEFQVAVSGRGVEVEVVLLHVLAVVPLGAGEAEETLLENGVVAVPQGQGEAQVLAPVADAGQPVLVPAVGAAASVVVREVVPGGAVLAVILPNRAPGPFRQVGTPSQPVGLAVVVRLQAPVLGGLLRHRPYPTQCR